MKNLMITTALVCAATGAAHAGEVTYGSAELSYFNGDDYDLTRVDGAIDYVANKFSFTGAAKAFDYDGGELYTLSATAGYEIMPGLNGYVKFSTFDFDYTDAVNAYGLGVDYTGASFGVAFEYTTVDDEDFDTYNLNGYYGFGASTVYGSFTNLDGEYNIYSLGYGYDAGAFDVSVATGFTEDGFDYGFSSIVGGYDFGKFGIKANILTENEDLFDNGFYGISGSYAITDQVSIEAGYDTTFGDYSDYDLVSLKLTYEFGGQRTRVTDRVTDFFDGAQSPILKAEAFDIFQPVYGPGLLSGF